MEQLKLKLDYLGYNPNVKEIKIEKSYENLLKTIGNLKLFDTSKLNSVTLDEIKNDAIEFYKKYFTIHDINFIPETDAKNFLSNINTTGLNELEAKTLYKSYYEKTIKKSPFELPLKLVKGHSMVGKIQKPIMMLPKGCIPLDVGVVIPFSGIELGEQLTKISSSTYIHEMAHIQQESNPGYAKNYLIRDVISIFLEKLSALEFDSTRQLLKISENNRFSDLADAIKQISLDGKLFKLSDEKRIETMIYFQSTLLAEKLFDLYLNERKQKNRDKYIYDIQDVFDGKQTVEDIIQKRNITINQGKDISLIKRHI